jgi:hypothetical protein
VTKNSKISSFSQRFRISHPDPEKSPSSQHVKRARKKFLGDSLSLLHDYLPRCKLQCIVGILKCCRVLFILSVRRKDWPELIIENSKSNARKTWQQFRCMQLGELKLPLPLVAQWQNKIFHFHKSNASNLARDNTELNSGVRVRRPEFHHIYWSSELAKSFLSYLMEFRVSNCHISWS